MTRAYKLGIVLLLFGLTLISLNLVGIFIPLRNSDIYSEKQTYFENDIVFSEEELLEKLVRNGESDKEFVSKINDLIFKGIAHYWKEEGLDKYNIRLPIYENYILFLAGYIFPSKFEKYEFTNYRKGIERGIGLCSQHAIILSEVLKNNGISNKIIGMSCHVVVMAQVNNDPEDWWIVDADFGVIIDKNIAEIQKSPEIIQPYYKEKGYDSVIINDVTNCYGNVDRIYNGAVDYSGKKRYYIEKLSYVGIWIIPLFLIMISIKLILKNRKSLLP